MKSKVKIEIQPKQKISDEEIKQAMDFEGVLKKANRDGLAALRFKFGMNLNSLLISIGVILVTSTYFLLSHPSKPSTPTVQKNTGDTLIFQEASKNTQAENQFPISQVKSSKQVNIPKQADDFNTSSSQKEEVPQFDEIKNDSLTLIPTFLTSMPVEKEKETELKPVIVPAEPLNGYPQFYEYFERERKYPKEAFEQKIQGEVIVRCIINTEGIASHFEIIKSLTKECDAEVIRLMENMGPWKPATVNGVPTIYQVELPVTFSINPGNK